MDAPDTLHHIMVRGIEKRRIFEGNRDREDFLERLGKVVQEGQASCFAWVLIPNHAHILLRTGPVPLPRMMRRLLTGYAVSFNLRHQRVGHLFQNRYRSIVCDEDAYLLELVRYIHLNAVRAGLVKDMEGLDRYRWSGHSVLMGTVNRGWQSKKEVLSYFGEKEREARKRYRQFILEGMGLGRREDLSTGRMVKDGEKIIGEKSGIEDSRVLGNSSFLEKVLMRTGRSAQERLSLRRKQVDLDRMLDFIGNKFEVSKDEILGRSRRREISTARSLFCYICTRKLGMAGRQLSEKLQVTPAGVQLASDRGERLIEENKELEEAFENYLNNLTTSPEAFGVLETGGK